MLISDLKEIQEKYMQRKYSNKLFFQQKVIGPVKKDFWIYLLLVPFLKFSSRSEININF
jgi:hypothetical protein